MPIENTAYAVNETTYELYPAGIYEAKLVELEERILINKDTKEPVEKIEWTFEVLSGPLKGKQIRDLCTKVAALTPRTKMRQWMEGMTGKSLQGLPQANPNKLIGRECYITLFRGLNQAGRDVNKITALSPKAQGAPAPMPQPAPVAAAPSNGADEDSPY